MTISHRGDIAAGERVADRYRVERVLGVGGTGTVYLATDDISTEQVAVKVLAPLTTAAALRHRREVLALRLLQTPGVVRLLDDGTWENRPFLVMEYVAGAPFPQHGPRAWSEVGPLFLSLLDSLARVHAAGVIHRDLKPGNVLLDGAGRPVLLDFGLARGENLGEAITRPDTVVGTPRYQSPEQLTGQTLDPRTDLYSVGVMMFEVLSGRPPHPLDSHSALLSARLWRDAPPLSYVSPDTPAAVCRVVDDLLARLPEARPRTAAEVIDALGLLPGQAAVGQLPWLGPDTPMVAALSAARAGRSLDLSGAPGTGKTRCLNEIAAALARDGRRTAWTNPGSRPYQSLAAIVGEPAPFETVEGAAPKALSPAEIEHQLERRLTETLAGGTAVLVDDAEQLDPWSAALVDRARERGTLLRAWRTPRANAVALLPITEAELRALFHGPDRLLHLVEDGARALAARTDGHPARVVTEIAAWVAGGIATWREGRIAVERVALDRLQGSDQVRAPVAAWPPLRLPLPHALDQALAWVTLAWPHATPSLLGAVQGGSAWEIGLMLDGLEAVGAVVRTADGRVEPRVEAPALQRWSPEERRDAHARLAAHLQPGETGRLHHLFGAEDYVGAAREAGRIGAQIASDGYAGRALGVLIQGIYAARTAEAEDEEAQLLNAAAAEALSENSSTAIEHVRYELRQSPAADRYRQLDQLLTAAIGALREGFGGLRDRIAGITPFADPHLEVWRRTQQFQAALAEGTAEEVVAEQLAWAEAADNPFLLGRVYGWQGLLRYRQGRFVEAAELHMRALPLKERVADRLSTLLNAAAAYTEADRPEHALLLATQAEALARTCRLPVFEARAVGARRTITYRSASAESPDLELAEACRILGSPSVTAAILLGEAARAWRAGMHAEGSRLARESEAAYARQGMGLALVSARAIALLCEGTRDADAWAVVAATAGASADQSGVAEVYGLVALGSDTWETTWADRVERVLSTFAAQAPDRRRTVLADAEIRAYCRVRL